MQYKMIFDRMMLEVNTEEKLNDESGNYEQVRQEIMMKNKYPSIVFPVSTLRSATCR